MKIELSNNALAIISHLWFIASMFAEGYNRIFMFIIGGAYLVFSLYGQKARERT